MKTYYLFFIIFFMSQSRRNIQNHVKSCKYVKSLFNELDNDIKTTHVQNKSVRITDTF